MHSRETEIADLVGQHIQSKEKKLEWDGEGRSEE
jgi:hypothetical protein